MTINEAINELTQCYSFNASEKKNEAISMAIKSLKRQQWVPVAERLPDKSAVYTITDYYGRVARLAFHDNERNYKYWRNYVKAWMPKPEPYRESRPE